MDLWWYLNTRIPTKIAFRLWKPVDKWWKSYTDNWGGGDPEMMWWVILCLKSFEEIVSWHMVSSGTSRGWKERKCVLEIKPQRCIRNVDCWEDIVSRETTNLTKKQDPTIIPALKWEHCNQRPWSSINICMRYKYTCSSWGQTCISYKDPQFLEKMEKMPLSKRGAEQGAPYEVNYA